MVALRKPPNVVAGILCGVAAILHSRRRSSSSGRPRKWACRVPVKLVIQGQPDQLIYVNLNQLHSPKASISRTVTARRNYPALEAAMATPARRAMIPPIEVQPLGAPGQTGSVPLAQVKIVN